jgi:hypothetical protein
MASWSCCRCSGERSSRLTSMMSVMSGILIYSAVVPLGVPKSVLTQNVHPAPNTQQAEQSWLHTRKESRDVPVNFFLKINKR